VKWAEPNRARRRFNVLNERAEALGRKALQYERAASIATDPDACCAYLDLSRQLRAKAEEVWAFERVAYLRQGNLVAGVRSTAMTPTMHARHPSGCVAFIGLSDGTG
jgi:hypothetical protein